MPETPLPWRAEALQALLEPLLPGVQVEVVASLPSTNTALLERARAATSPRDRDALDPHGGDVIVRRSVESAAFGRAAPAPAVDLSPCLLVAEHQSAGRGRQGRAWRSAPGASLTFSLALPLAAADWSGLSLVVGVALCEAIGALLPEKARASVGLKWPNDLWLMDAPARGRKLGGVLIETVSAGTQRLAVIGIGVNVAPFEAEAPATGFAALQELAPALDAPALLGQIAVPLVQALQRFGREGFAPFAAAFAAHDVLHGLRVTTTSAEQPEGVARGVSARGALRVDAGGRIVEIGSGEVSVRLAAEAAC